MKAATVAACILPIAACSAPDSAPDRNRPKRQEASAPLPAPAPPRPTSAAEPRFTGAPAQPLGAQPASRSAILGKVDRPQAGEPRCEINFAYRGYAPESLFWEEACAGLTVAFLDRAELEKLDLWNRLKRDAQESIETRTAGKVLYVAGEFSASIFPVSYNQLTEKIAVND